VKRGEVFSVCNFFPDLFASQAAAKPSFIPDKTLKLILKFKVILIYLFPGL
jgi:hypothetical protein